MYNNLISATDLKKNGVSIISKIIKKTGEAIISVRGKGKYVILPLETYNYLKECELEAALLEIKEDIKNEKYHTSIEKHIKDIKEYINEEDDNV
ncbi:prevent-host-death protein [Marinitoga lauensis]|uniref:prevent-host-death protein n=1 Tax=Marinitoga lauensis TaxID=2201189 RepID=UPI0010116561|nr:prevent-host-death protein [Marinitoga lauensis]